MPFEIQLSVILPCYNEAPSLRALADAYLAAMKPHSFTYEVLFVDNGSTDLSSEWFSKHFGGVSYPKSFRWLKLEMNQGYGGGILEGLKQASGEFVGWSHADQQCAPQDVVRLFEAVQNDIEPTHCFGKGIRTNDRGANGLISRCHELSASTLLGVTLKEINAQPKVFHRSLMTHLLEKAPKGFEWDVYAYFVAMKHHYRLITVPVEFLPRPHGQSHWAHSVRSRLTTIVQQIRYLWKLRKVAL